MTDVFIIWPEKRWVSEEKITTWFSDAVANGRIAPHYLRAKTTEEMAAALDDAGYLTVGRPPE